MDKDYIVLKRGTLKEWRLTSEKGKKLLQEYLNLGSSLSGMAQRDTPRQKELICQMIDEVPGDIYLSRLEVYIGKEEAKQYMNEYGSLQEQGGL